MNNFCQSGLVDGAGFFAAAFLWAGMVDARARSGMQGIVASWVFKRVRLVETFK